MERAKLISGISPIEERRAAREAARAYFPKKVPPMSWRPDNYVEADRTVSKNAKHLVQ